MTSDPRFIIGVRAVEVCFAAIGIDAGQRDKDKAGVQFLPYAPIRLAVKELDEIFVGRIEFRNGSVLSIQVGECLDPIARVGERGCAAVFGIAFGIFDEAEGERLVSGIGRGIDLTTRLVLGAGHEGFDGTTRLSLDSKDEMQLAVKMGFGHCKGIVSPIIDDDIFRAQMIEMRKCGVAFILVIEEIKIDRHATEQTIENTDQILRIVGIGMRFTIAPSRHGDREMIL